MGTSRRLRRYTPSATFTVQVGKRGESPALLNENGLGQILESCYDPKGWKNTDGTPAFVVVERGMHIDTSGYEMLRFVISTRNMITDAQMHAWEATFDGVAGEILRYFQSQNQQYCQVELSVSYVTLEKTIVGNSPQLNPAS